MNRCRVLIACMLAGWAPFFTATALADDPPAAVAEDESAAPIETEADQDVAAAAETEAADGDNAASNDESAPDPNAGLADLDKATQLKIAAENLPDLNDVVDKLDSALEKGLDEDNRTFAQELLLSALLQRAAVLSSAILDRPLVDPRRDPRWMQVRQFAMNDLHRALSIDNELWEAHLLIGRLQALPLGDEKTAQRELTIVIDAPTAEPEHRAQALALRGALQSDEKKRASDFDEAIALVPDRPDYYRVRAQYRYSQDQFADALADVDRALEMDPDHAQTQELRGLILLGLDRFDDALATFNKAGELAPEAVMPYQHRGEVYRRKGDLKKAAEQLSKALEIAPGDAATLLLRANILYQLDDPDGAIKDIETVIEAQPQLLLAHLLRAEILTATDRVDLAIEQLEALLSLAPDQTRLLEPLARYYLIAGRPRKSIETFDKVIKLEPENYGALRYRGDAYLNIGKHKEAVADFDAAVAIRDDDDGLLNNFAWVLATSPDENVRDGKRAVELATKAAEMSSYTVPHILSTLAAAYAETGDFETAQKWSKKAVELGENDDSREQLEKELASYEEGKPWRERQEQQEKAPKPSSNDHTFAPASATPAPARTTDF